MERIYGLVVLGPGLGHGSDNRPDGRVSAAGSLSDPLGARPQRVGAPLPPGVSDWLEPSWPTPLGVGGGWVLRGAKLHSSLALHVGFWQRAICTLADANADYCGSHR